MISPAGSGSRGRNWHFFVGGCPRKLVEVAMFAGKIGPIGLADCQPPTMSKWLVANSTSETSAARSRPRAEGCNLALLESKPVRSAAGLPCSRNRSVRTERAAASPREGPLLAYRSSAVPSQAAARVCRFCFAPEPACPRKIDPVGIGGPQPPGLGGPQLASRRSASSVRSAGCAPNSILSVAKAPF